ncbi:MCE family protein [Nocardia sp. NBC_00565]|uniref:MlaD family protein n=1 Tax=Nocardia sp. NBC_00565 TaxID=2975993 RepID=UPI002E81C8D1|nr:MlaD family protein [Nocardia sp. NBC_00565]WUC01926.1 MCE family protein [Nocardia sp. NBC_00565]
MNFRRSLIVLVVFVVVSVVLTWTVVVTLGRGVSGPTTEYSALFTNVSGLRAGDDVRMAGVRVGRVESIELTGNLARVGFSVRDDQVVYGDTKASVTYQNLIGQRYLGLALGARGDHVALKSGAQIPVERTEPSFDISNLLNGFEPLFATIDHTAIDNITDALIKALQGDNGSVATLIAETTSLAQNFVGPDEILGQVINNLTTIVSNLAAQSGNLTTVIDQSRAVFEGLNARREPLFDSVDQVSAMVGRVSQIAAADQPALGEFLSRDPGFAQHFMDNKNKFEFMGENLPLLMKGLARISNSGAYIEGYICDVTISLLPGLSPLLPQIVDAISPSGTAQHTARCR